MLTVVGWGLNWPLMKIVLREWPPLFARGSAGLVAALLMGLIAYLVGEQVRVAPRHMPSLALSAFTNVFAWMGLGTMAMVWLTVSEGALLVYTMPIWTTLFAWPMLGTRPTGSSVIALLLGIAGIATLLGGASFDLDGPRAGGVALALACAAFMGFGTVRGRRFPLALPPITMTAWQIAIGCLPMVLIGVFSERPNYGALSVQGWLCMIYMALCPMGLCYLTWFAALRILPPATAATAMLLVPLVGALSAALIIGEHLGAREAAAFALTLTGVALAIRSS